MTATTDRYRTLADAFEAKVVAVRPEDWANPSPCAQWTARDVVGHVVDVHGMMLQPLETGLSVGPSAADDPLGAFRSARADLERVIDDPKVSDRVDQFMCFDLVVHGWDLARATGQDEAIDDTEVDRVLAFVDQMGTARMQENGVIGPEVTVPPDGPKQHRMLGLLGRDPG